MGHFSALLVERRKGSMKGYKTMYKTLRVAVILAMSDLDCGMSDMALIRLGNILSSLERYEAKEILGTQNLKRKKEDR